jgi:hypothetical protein
MKTKFILLTVLAALFLSCKSDTKNEIPSSSEKEELNIDESIKLKLDNGQKWIANEETHIGIKNMDSIIKAFELDNNKDYLVLGKALSKQTSFVIKNCTMKGEPHDLLHVVLVPMLDEISVLKETQNNLDASKALENLKTLIIKYFIHFKIL